MSIIFRIFCNTGLHWVSGDYTPLTKFISLHSVQPFTLLVCRRLAAWNPLPVRVAQKIFRCIIRIGEKNTFIACMCMILCISLIYFYWYLFLCSVLVCKEFNLIHKKFWHSLTQFTTFYHKLTQLFLFWYRLFNIHSYLLNNI